MVRNDEMKIGRGLAFSLLYEKDLRKTHHVDQRSEHHRAIQEDVIIRGVKDRITNMVVYVYVYSEKIPVHTVTTLSHHILNGSKHELPIFY